MKVRQCANLHVIQRRGFPNGAGRALVETGAFNLKYIIQVRIFKEHISGEKLVGINVCIRLLC